jgi:site-specific recombinase XerD
MTTKPFASPLGHDLEAFLAHKRSLGRYANRREELRLRSFDRFVAEHARGKRAVVVQHVVARWLARDEGRRLRTVESELTLIRQFARFLQRQDPARVVLDPERLPLLPRRPRFRPHIFSRAEIRLLLRETRTMRPPPFRALTFQTLLLAMYCTGLRPGEAVRLTLGDTDLRARTFFVRKSKGKSRWVPFHDDLARRLRKYIAIRSAISPATPEARLFVQPRGRPYSAELCSWILRHLFRRAGLKPARGRVGPRPYDFRHSFAVHCLTRWYREGVDLHARLPWLSAYMGHEDLLGTEWYLRATPELLRFASRRFAARFRRRERA